MSKVRFIASFFIELLVLCTDVVLGQTYPNKPVRILASEAGGTPDFAARMIAYALSGRMKQQMIVDNLPSKFTGEVAAKATPDGYTLIVAGGSLWVGPLVRKTLYDPVADFSPIALISSAPHILVVHPQVPVKSVLELIALAKARPGELNYSSSGIGGANQLAAELFKAKAGVNIVNISYKGGAAALNDLISGQVQLSFAPAAVGLQHVKSGKLRALAVTSAEPTKLAPGLPTVASSGVPNYESSVNVGILAPHNTPAAIINQLNDEIVRVLNEPEVKEKFINAGSDIVASSPNEFAAKIKSEMFELGKIIRDLGIKEGE